MLAKHELLPFLSLSLCACVSRLQFNNKYLNDVFDRSDSKSCQQNDPFGERDVNKHSCFPRYVRTNHDIAHVARHDDRFLFQKSTENA